MNNNLNFENTDRILNETRVFASNPGLARQSNIAALMQQKGFEETDYRGFYEWSLANRFEFWQEMAGELSWFEPWNKVFEWNTRPFFKWFVDGKLNVVYNCLDRFIDTPVADKVAYYWEGDDGSSRSLTYRELYLLVNRLANGLKKLGVKKGDRVAIYMPVIPEQVAAMLAVARLGAVHTVVFAGFTSQALRDRCNDAEVKLLITADGYYRGGKLVELKKNAEAGAAEVSSLEHILVYPRLGLDVPMQAGRDVAWDDLLGPPEVEQTLVPCEPMDSEDPLYILYTSGSTGKPKGAVHVHGGYGVGVYATFKLVFDSKPEDIYWCTADLGWTTAHSYVVYGPLLNGTTSILFEGVPGYPAPDRWWSIIEKYRATIFYTAPTAIRSFMRQGEEWPARHDLSSLRLLGSVGEPINPEAWIWYRQNIGRGVLPIMDTWWQTETGSIMISPTPVLPLKPGSASWPFPTIEAAVVNREGKPVEAGKGGFLVVRFPWPALMRTVFRDPTRYETYWNTIQDVYLAGDAAHRDSDGYFWIQGRVDEVIKVSGHRLGSTEIESSLVSHPAVAEAAAIGKPDPIKGEHIMVFVILRNDYAGQEERLAQELKLHVRNTLGPVAVPDELKFVDNLPKNRGGKIMRRLLKAQELGEPPGDTSTLDT